VFDLGSSPTIQVQVHYLHSSGFRIPNRDYFTNGIVSVAPISSPPIHHATNGTGNFIMDFRAIP
jgi:hypothetical protein